MPRLRRLKIYDRIEKEKDPEDFVGELSDNIEELSADECLDDEGRTILVDRDSTSNGLPEESTTNVDSRSGTDQQSLHKRKGDGKYTSLSTDNTSATYEETSALRHWLSDEVIISSLSDERLQSSLERYENAVRLIRQELTRRSLEPQRTSHTRGRYPSDKLAGSLQYLQDQMFGGVEERPTSSRRGKNKGTRTKQRSPTKSVADALLKGTLTPEQVWKVLQEKLKGEGK